MIDLTVLINSKRNVFHRLNLCDHRSTTFSGLHYLIHKEKQREHSTLSEDDRAREIDTKIQLHPLFPSRTLHHQNRLYRSDRYSS